MPTKLKHYNPSQDSLKNAWRLFDAKGQVLGRMASDIAMALMGKDRPEYVPHMMSGDFVIVINAVEVVVTGRKYDQKIYRRHSRYPGGLKEIPYAKLSSTMPERIIEHAVKGMLPKNKLGRRLMTRLKVYPGPQHPHMAQLAGHQNVDAQRSESMREAQ